MPSVLPRGWYRLAEIYFCNWRLLRQHLFKRTEQIGIGIRHLGIWLPINVRVTDSHRPYICTGINGGLHQARLERLQFVAFRRRAFRKITKAIPRLQTVRGYFYHAPRILTSRPIRKQGIRLLGQPAENRPSANFRHRYKSNSADAVNDVDIKPRNMVCHKHDAGKLRARDGAMDNQPDIEDVQQALAPVANDAIAFLRTDPGQNKRSRQKTECDMKKKADSAN